MNDTRTIPLSKGQTALISAEDFEEISQYSWHITQHGYAARCGKGNEHEYLHRRINKTPEGMFTDHIDRNKLNCTRENLRTVTPAQNSMNQSKQSRPTHSQFKGVSFRPGRGKDKNKGASWPAYIKSGSKKKALGYFKTELDAAFAYNLEAEKLFGKHSAVNVLPLDYLASHKEPEPFKARKNSKYRGVMSHRQSGLWCARLIRNKEIKHCSYHKTEEDAAVAWNSAAMLLGVPAAKLNQIYA